MFTLKFLTLNTMFDPEREHEAVVSAVRYDVTKYEEGVYSIAVYQKTTSDEEGTEYRVSNYKQDFANCYIENIAGKTIAHYTSVAGEPETEAPQTQ